MPLSLTVDLGNSRTKLCAWREAGRPALVASAACATSAGLAEPVRAFVTGLGAARFVRAGMSSVAAQGPTAAAERALQELLGEHYVPELEVGLDNATEAPEQVGRDRLFAARAAYELHGDAIVVDAGTALTVDGVRTSDGRAVFEGGAIAAGPRVLSEALGRAGARLEEVEPEPGVPCVGRSSRAALAAGVVHGFRGAARELVLGVGRELALEDAALVVTGGARHFLLEPPLFGARPRVEPELVHLGILFALRASGGA